MDMKQYQDYQNSMRSLLNQALVEGLKRNDEQTKTWYDYRQAHKKVKKGLEILPQELTTNCMVPIGKKALMKGKLQHTNEILVCLGDGYFAKYSAKQAVELCDRRIKQADEMLRSLEKEKNLLEMRRSLPEDLGIFGDADRQEIVEEYDEEREQQWRIEHRKREKEYRQKLADHKAKEKTVIETEQDLWQRLDELELQEELEDEINRLQEDDCNYYGEEGTEEYDSEEDASFSEDETTDDMIEKGIEELKLNKTIKPDEESRKPEIQNPSSNIGQEVMSTSESMKVKVNDHTESTRNPIIGLGKSNQRVDPEETKQEVGFKKIDRLETSDSVVTAGQHKRRVSFYDPKLDEPSEKKSDSNIASSESKGEGSSGRQQQPEEDDDDVVRIEFRHSDRDFGIPVESEPNNTIQSPADIFRSFNQPKSILKKSPSNSNNVRDIPPPVDVTSDDEEDDPPSDSSYTIIVKDIEEHKLDLTEMKDPPTSKRPMSKFRMARSGMNR